MGKKIIILGGTGNISTLIVEKALQKGHEVWCYNRGKSKSELPPEVKCIIGDRADRELFEQTMKQHSFDIIIDMIAFSAEDAKSAIRSFPQIEQYIFCSTVCVVGIKADYLPFDENHVLRPITDYGKGKAEAEAVFMQEFYKNNYPVTILRPSTTYGRQPSLIRQISWDSSWVDRVRKGKPIIMCGDGMALHQFMHSDDAAAGFVEVIGQKQTFGKVYNLVKDDCITWKQFHLTAMKVLGKEAELIYVPYKLLRQHDIPGFSIYDEIFAHHSYHSNAKLKKDIPSFSPKISLELGLEKTFDYMQKNNLIPNSDEVTWEDDIIKSISY